MIIFTLIAIAVAFYVLYALFVKGIFYGLALFTGSVIGLRYVLLEFFPNSSETLLTISAYNISYATVGATIISVLGIGYFLQAGEK